MKPRFLTSIFTVFLILVIVSCSKDSSNSGGGTEMTPLEKRADSLHHYVIDKHFIPVDFYSSRPIDYNEDDAEIDSITDLTPFIMRYLSDDVITFKDNGDLIVDQGGIQYKSPTGETLDSVFTKDWEVTTMKATNEVFLKYLSYTYEPRRYTLDYMNDTGMLMHVAWQSKTNDTATLYTRYVRK